jgi:hypothetical protein
MEISRGRVVAHALSTHARSRVDRRRFSGRHMTLLSTARPRAVGPQPFAADVSTHQPVDPPEPAKALRRLAWAIFLLVGLLAIVGYELLPAGPTTPSTWRSA